MGINALEPSRFDINYQQQGQFNEKVIYDLDCLRASLNVLKQQQASTTTHDGKQDGAISQLEQAITNLQNALKQANTSFSTLQSDNGTFKSDVTQTVSDFHKALDTFQGELTANSKLSNDNASAISTLKTQIDPGKWNNILSGLDNIDNIVQSKVTAATTPISTNLDTKFTALKGDVSSQISSVTQGLNTQIANTTNNLTDLTQTVGTNSGNIGKNTKAISQENSRAMQAEGGLQSSIDALSTKEDTDISQQAAALRAATQNASQKHADMQTQWGKDINTAIQTLNSNLSDAIDKANTDAVTRSNGYTDTKTTGLVASANDYTDKQLKPIHEEAEAATSTAGAATDRGNQAVNTANTANQTANTANTNAKNALKKVASVLKSLATMPLPHNIPYVGTGWVDQFIKTSGNVTIEPVSSEVSVWVFWGSGQGGTGLGTQGHNTSTVSAGYDGLVVCISSQGLAAYAFWGDSDPNKVVWKSLQVFAEQS